MRRAGVAFVLVIVGGALLGGCGDDDQGDLASFCDAVQALRDDDPFEELTVASPEEMQAAFEQLQDGAEQVAEHAPPDQRPRATAFRDSVDELVDEMRTAGYDRRALDDLAYRSAVDDYVDAAIAVENAADASCP